MCMVDNLHNIFMAFQLLEDLDFFIDHFPHVVSLYILRFANILSITVFNEIDLPKSSCVKQRKI